MFHFPTDAVPQFLKKLTPLFDGNFRLVATEMDLQVDASCKKSHFSTTWHAHSHNLYHRKQYLTNVHLRVTGDQTGEKCIQLACKSELDQSAHRPSKYSVHAKKWPTGLHLHATLFLKKSFSANNLYTRFH